MFDKIEFETALMDLSAIENDVKIVTEIILEKEPSKDEITNALIGIETLFKMKFDKVFDMFEQGLKEKKIL